MVWSYCDQKINFDNTGESYEKLGRFIIFDIKGNLLRQGKQILPAEYQTEFQELFYRQHYDSLFQDSEHYAFSKDGQYGANVSDCGWSSKGCEIELWDLFKEKLVWRILVENSLIELIKFINFEGNENVLLAFHDEAILVSKENGEIVSKLNFSSVNSIDSNSEVFKRNFFASEISYNENTSFLACGELESRRIRIYNLRDKCLVYELNSTDPPYRPSGGCWNVSHLEFNENGKYLIAEYLFTGRYTFYRCLPTEVYDTVTKRLCWYENEEDVYSVTISPDGSKIAFIRNQYLEIGDFSEEGNQGRISIIDY